MDELQEKDNRSILCLLLGVFIIPTINGLEGLINGLLKSFGLSMTHRLITSIAFDTIFILGLIIGIILVLRHGTNKYSQYFNISLSKFRLYGLIFILIIIAGRVTNYFLITDYTKEIKMLESDEKYDLLRESADYYLTETILTITRETLLFIAFFSATIKKWK